MRPPRSLPWSSSQCRMWTAASSGGASKRCAPFANIWRSPRRSRSCEPRSMQCARRTKGCWIGSSVWSLNRKSKLSVVADWTNVVAGVPPSHLFGQHHRRGLDKNRYRVADLKFKFLYRFSRHDGHDVVIADTHAHFGHKAVDFNILDRTRQPITRAKLHRSEPPAVSRPLVPARARTRQSSGADRCRAAIARSEE